MIEYKFEVNFVLEYQGKYLQIHRVICTCGPNVMMLIGWWSMVRVSSKRGKFDLKVKFDIKDQGQSHLKQRES